VGARHREQDQAVTVIQLVDARSGEVFDTVTFDGGRIAYDTGDARDLIESRAELAEDTGQLIASLDGWSNGYVATRLL
jgi:hypothetical protein